jgi:hypothetical protein
MRRDLEGCIEMCTESPSGKGKGEFFCVIIA